ncbi:zinc finger CCCH domain-containing protein 11A isoform X2 [Parambassis ranga]|uniref:Zinc finger CCCH domain-containing protein 11A isoform X2 n=1 Tax=Parambassis ranga TaxID=210632 RepID=A0A6P7I0F3_9TELE|nr:zinc finger CCCH domain-containing protein 11A-like isoform X2 [Parambassis ranga]
MTNHGDDCYFFFYSTCSKGDSCPFRHCEAAMGNETVCNLWQEGRCFRAVCKFRHMEITKNRKEIPCYWENQPAGCKKPHCAFFHEKPRYIQGIFVQPDKSVIKTEEQQHEEPPPPPAAPLPTTANPQLRGVIKTETLEPVPSPTHPPVVINPADDDEDEDDQFSEEGEDGKVGPPPRKLAKSGDSLNFGVSTLEEIRLRKALKASMKRAGFPLQCAETSTNGEKENIQSPFQPPVFEDRDGSLMYEEASRPRGSMAERLGRKIPSAGVKNEAVPLKRSLADRLGRVVDEQPPSVLPQKLVKPIKERLGMPSGSVATTQSAETSLMSKKTPEPVRIKTLEEIKQEKAAKSQCQSHKDAPSVVAPENTTTKTATKGIKRAITVKDTSDRHVKTFSEILRAKKKRQEEQNSSPTTANNTVEKGPSKTQKESETAGLDPEPTNVTEVKVKTLEEIRREKATRIQVQQSKEAEKRKNTDAEENGAKKPALLHIKKQASQKANTATEKSAELTVKPQKTPAAASETNNVKVKTFEEIMREKRLRKQEMQAKSSSEEEPPQNQTVAVTLKRNLKIGLASTGSSSPSSTTADPDSTLPTQKVPVCNLVTLKSKAASPQSSTATPDTTVACVPVKAGSPPQQSMNSSRQTSNKHTRTTTALLPAKQAGVSSQDPTAEAATTQKKSPATDTKVRPKLNVKPSVMKPAVQVKPGQKRKGAERSAVAAVKPLNSASTVQEEPLQETACRDRQAFPSFSAEAQLSSAVPHSPSTSLDCGSSSSPLREDLQTVSVFKKSPGKESQPAANAAATREACTVPQSPVPNTPTQSKPRRSSVAASRAASTSAASAVDDFEDLINEFTDDQLEDDVDPAIGEDDLLQELSEMIDS